MKKLIMVLFALMFTATAFASLNWVGNSSISVNTVWYNGSSSAHENDFHAAVLGILSAIVLGGEIQSEDASGDEAKMGYKIDDGSPEFVNLPLTVPGLTETWQSFPGVMIDLSGLSDGIHTLEVWFNVHEPFTGYLYDDNSGSNYIATFATLGTSPITLASFTAKAKKGVVEVAWTTGSETENSHFLVYRDGEVIAQVDGAGTTSETNDYVVVDDAVVPGVHEYALADVSYAGVEKVHETVSVEVGASVSAADFVLNKAYPNPFNPTTAISYQLSAVSDMNLSIYNTSGELVETLYNGEHPAGSHELVWNAANMPSGVYIVKMIAANVMSSQKIVLMK